MLRVFVSILPALAAVGAVAVVFRVNVGGSEEQRFRKLLVLAMLGGLLVAVISYWLVGAAGESARITATQLAVEENTKKITWDVSEEYEQRIAGLNAQILALQRRLASQPQDIPAGGAGHVSTGGQGAATPQIYWTQEPLKEGDSGEQEVHFKVYGPLNIPAFVAVCDQPCRIERANAGPDSEGTQLAGSTSRNVAGYIFKKPRPMPAGAEGFLILRGNKAGFTVTEFRALAESEIPANLK